jgi:hypothetical protein
MLSEELTDCLFFCTHVNFEARKSVECRTSPGVHSSLRILKLSNTLRILCPPPPFQNYLYLLTVTLFITLKAAPRGAGITTGNPFSNSSLVNELYRRQIVEPAYIVH